jgi:hypothetical protein
VPVVLVFTPFAFFAPLAFVRVADLFLLDLVTFPALALFTLFDPALPLPLSALTFLRPAAVFDTPPLRVFALLALLAALPDFPRDLLIAFDLALAPFRDLDCPTRIFLPARDFLEFFETPPSLGGVLQAARFSR